MASEERKIESRLVKYCKAKGIYCRKWVSPGHSGVPDRILIGPLGVVFLELKAPGKDIRPIQELELDRIRAAGGRAFWADSWEGAKAVADCTLKETSAEYSHDLPTKRT